MLTVGQTVPFGKYDWPVLGVKKVAFVDACGCICLSRHYANGGDGVRPAMWIKM